MKQSEKYVYWRSPDSRHVLLLGDCLDILPTLPKVDAVVTDPPYGILNVESGCTSAVRKSRRSTGSGKLKNRFINTADFGWDTHPPSQETFDAIRSIAGEVIIWGGNYFPLPPSRCVLCWDKLQAWENFSQVEIAWTNIERPAAIFRHSKSAITGKVHPTQKPVELMEWCVKMTTGTVFDPFMGSGTTGVACIRLGRKFIGIEISREYCDIAVERMEREMSQPQLPGLEPEKVAQGTMFES